MSLRKLADETVRKIDSSIASQLSEHDISVLTKIVEGALAEAVNASTRSCSNAAVVCCGPEADLAHKIAEDVERARYALLANLASMR